MRLILRVGAWGVADVEILDPFQIIAILRKSRQESTRPPIGFGAPQPTEENT